MDRNSRSLNELCDGIRKNDPSINNVYISVCNHTQVDSLLKALHENSTVTTLVLDICPNDSDSNEPFTPLLQYLKTCTSIRAVELEPSRFHECWWAPEGRFLRVLAENPRMELVEFQSQAFLFSNDVTALLEAKLHCLRHLHIERPYACRGEQFNSSLGTLAQAVGSLLVLESVNVRFPGSEYTILMLGKLNAHPWLRKLSVEEYNGNPSTVHAVSTLLQSAVKLEVLELTGFCWDREKIESLVQGLESCLTLVNLKLNRCRFGRSSKDNHAFAHGVRKCKSISELHLNNCANTVRILSSVLVPVESENAKAANYMGSSLLVLDVRERLFDIKAVLIPLTMRGSQLVELTLDGLTDSTFSQLTRYVPELRCLRELKLVLEDGHCRHFDSWSFLRAVCKNVTLRHVSVSCENNSSNGAQMFDGLDCRKLLSFCDRNRWAPEMLQGSNFTKDNMEKRHTPSLIPSLCMVMRQAQRMVPTILFAGMLAANDTIGFTGNEKRIRYPVT
jgi:hypothetical protein